MKTLLSICAILLLAVAELSAQYPPRSPVSFLRQEIGNAVVSVDYARPLARGRAVFGGLVPYNEQWRVTANGIVFSFSGPVDVAGQTVPAGKYALMIIPGETEWTVLLNSAPDGVGHYDPANDAAQVCVPVTKPGRFYEAFSLEFDLTPGGAQLYISWTDVQVSIPFDTYVDKTALVHIDKVMADPASTVNDYFRAANHLIFVKQDLDKALELTNRLRAQEQGEYVWRMRKDIYAHRGQFAAALVAVDSAIVVVNQQFSGIDRKERLDFWKKERAQLRRQAAQRTTN